MGDLTSFTREDLREIFKNSNLSYDCITAKELKLLECLLNKEMSEQRTENLLNNTPEYWVAVNRDKAINQNYKDDDTLIYAFITGNGGYFESREVISFNKNGFIGFCGEASDKNLQPVARAFVKWCEYLKKD